MARVAITDVTKAISALLRACALPHMDSQAVVRVFQKNGYTPDNQTAYPQDANKATQGRWLINQGLGDLQQFGHLRPYFHQLVTKWRSMR